MSSLDDDDSTRRASILIVDDTRDSRNLLSLMLANEGFELRTAASGEEALAMIARSAPNLVLLDVVMPGLSGHEVARAIKNNRETRTIPVIMVTAHDDRDARRECLAAGVEDFLTKPVDRFELCMRVRNLLRLHAAIGDAERARAQAEVANRSKAEFLTVMSHELRTPLNAIGGYAELMQMGIHGPLTAEQAVDLGRIQESQRHLMALINGVLSYARIEAGTMQFSLGPQIVGAMLLACDQLVAPLAQARGVTLRYVPCRATLCAVADHDKFQQIVLNLLSNAVNFTPAGGDVELSASAGAGAAGVNVQVRDTGIGIAPDQLDRAFEPFVQIDMTLTRTRSGTGLGLAISRELARGMNGDLTVQSTLGAGSTFMLTLPSAHAS
jgi:signal transduction histidine kinase